MSGWTTASGGNPYLKEALHQAQGARAMMYRATRSYFNPTDDSHLMISRGELVEVDPSEQYDIPSGWLFGRLNSLAGVFPANSVEPIRGQHAGRSPPNESPTSWDKKANQDCGEIPSDASPPDTDAIYDLPPDCSSLCVYEAINNFDAKADEELSIKLGDFIYVQPSSQEHRDPGWLWGWIGEQGGFFPERYVKIVNENDSDGNYIHIQENEITLPFRMQVEIVRRMRESIDSLIDIIDDTCTNLRDTKEEFFLGRLSKVASSQEDYKRVLENWDSFIKHMKDLLRTLRSNEKVARDDPSQWAVGDILSEKFLQADKFTKCCCWRKDAEALLQKQSKHAIQKHLAGIFKTSDKADKSHEVPEAELVSVLQLPAKRINTYPALIKKVLETTPTDHADHASIQSAFVMSEDICRLINTINEDTKHNDEMKRIQEIVRGCETDFLSDTDCVGRRKLCFTSKLQELKGGQKQDCVGFLLNDQLLLGYPKSAKIPDAYMTNATKITFQASRPQPMYLNNLEVLLREVSDPTVFTLLCYDALEVISLNLKAESARQRTLWTKRIDETTKSYSMAKKKRLHLRNQKDADTSRTTYLSKYTFKTDYPQALNFEMGNVLKVGIRQEAANPGWMFGSFSNESGWFPKALVEQIPDSEGSSSYNKQPFEVEEAENTVEQIPATYEDTHEAPANHTYALEQTQHALKMADQFGHGATLPQYSEPQRKPVKPKKVSEEHLNNDILTKSSPRPPADGPVTLPRPMAKSKPTVGVKNIRESPKLSPMMDRSKEVNEVQRPPIQKKGPKILNQPKPAAHLADLETVLKARKHSGPPFMTKPNQQWTPIVGIRPSDLKLRTTSESSADQDQRPHIPPRRGGPPR